MLEITSLMREVDLGEKKHINQITPGHSKITRHAYYNSSESSVWKTFSTKHKAASFYEIQLDSIACKIGIVRLISSSIIGKCVREHTDRERRKENER